MMSKPPPKEVTSETHHAIDEKAKKEELVEARMKMMRKKNEELMRRQKEIEEDRKNADRYSEMAVKKHPESFSLGVNKEGVAAPGRGRGRGRGLMLQEMRKETLKAKQWEVKRKENVQKEEDERKRRKGTSNSVSRFLVDDDRVDMSKTSGRNEHSWGGANFKQVVNRVHREKEGFRPRRNQGNIEMTMSGRERQEYTHWREERMKIDEERKARQKKSGNWSRAWDQPKIWDPRKKMWVYENDDGSHSFQSTRRRDYSDNADDWGSDNRDRRRDHGERGSDRQASGHSTGFAQRDDHELPVSEDWGETSENKGAAQMNVGGMIQTTTEEWGETSESKVAEHKDSGGTLPSTEEWGDTSDGRVPQPAATEEWGETSEGRIVQSEVPESKGEKRPIMGHQHDSTVSDPSLGEDGKKELFATKNKEEISGTAKMTSDSSHSDVPKPQREITPRRRPLGSSGIHQADSNRELASVTNVAEAQSSSDKKDSNKLGMDIQEPTNIDKGPDKQLESNTVSTVQEKDFQDGKKKDNTEKADSLSENKVDNKQDTLMRDTHSTETEQLSESERAVKRKLAAEEAHLLKLVTKLDKKVTFDSSEESKPAIDTDAEDPTSETIGDIPPTPDFLKFDHTLEWGDIDVDAEDSEVIEPKW